MGVVNTVQDSGDIIVRYSNNKIFLINQFALTKVIALIRIIMVHIFAVCTLYAQKMRGTVDPRLSELIGTGPFTDK